MKENDYPDEGYPVWAEAKPAPAADGWVLVPVRPTQQMILAALTADEQALEHDGENAHPLDIYTTMLAAAPAAHAPAWQPIETAPHDELVVVTWLDREGAQQYEFDHREPDSCWQRWHDHAEHVEIIGGHRVSYTAPYTHWMPLLASAASKGEQA